MELSICSGVLNRILKHNGGTVSAWLIGSRHAGEVRLLSTVAACARDSGKKENVSLKADAESVRSLLPVGVEIVGVCTTASAGQGSQACAEQLAKTVKAVIFQGRLTALLVVAVNSGKNEVSFWTGTAKPQELHPEMAPVTSDAWLSETFALLRLSMPVRLEVIGSGKAKDAVTSLTAAFDAVRAQLCTEAAQFVAQLPDSADQVLLGSGESEATCNSSSVTLVRPAQLEMVTNSRTTSSAAPSVSYEPFKGGPLRLQRASLLLDILWYVPRTEPLSSLPVIRLRDAVRQQLQAMQQLLVQQGSVSDVRALHFRPPGLGLHCTIVYPLPATSGQDLEAAEDQLAEHRRALHRRLLLPLDRPMLCLANALSFGESGSSRSTVLQNVHEGIAPSGVAGGQTHMIWGDYSYHHYLQGKFNDSGWGCAYRSLQTICSWFRHQHFTSKPIPSHREVQQVLVDIGDKQRSFVGSSQWIGAIELGYVLDTLLGITSRIITVSDGADMDQQARQIAQHFDTQGTPIMIGGGVLAYTLLGIDYNPASGECAYLILDPHFTGADDLQKVHSGQWVAWKRSDSKAAAGGDLFVKHAFYNLLCPQRPNRI